MMPKKVNYTDYQKKMFLVMDLISDIRFSRRTKGTSLDTPEERKYHDDIDNIDRETGLIRNGFIPIFAK